MEDDSIEMNSGPLDPVERITTWMRTAIPEPKSKNRHTQLGVHFEEVAEMIEAITCNNDATQTVLLTAHAALMQLSNHLKKHDDVISVSEENRVLFLDAICDQLVTATGSGYVYGVDVTSGIAEVNRSNFSKFDETGEAIFNENRKFIKGPNYTPPDLTQFV